MNVHPFLCYVFSAWFLLPSFSIITFWIYTFQRTFIFSFLSPIETRNPLALVLSGGGAFLPSPAHRLLQGRRGQNQEVSRPGHEALHDWPGDHEQPPESAPQTQAILLSSPGNNLTRHIFCCSSKMHEGSPVSGYYQLVSLTEFNFFMFFSKAVRGQFMSMTKTTMTMEELLDQMMKKVTLECEDWHRQYIAALNGLAGIDIIEERWEDSVEKYREVLRLVFLTEEAF